MSRRTKILIGLNPPPRPEPFLLAESETLQTDVNVELRVTVDKTVMPEVPEELRVVMDDGTVYTGKVIDSTEGYHEYDVALMVTEEE